MEKTANFLNNQRYIGSERMKKMIYLNYKYNKKVNIDHSIIVFYIMLFLLFPLIRDIIDTKKYFGFILIFIVFLIPTTFAYFGKIIYIIMFYINKKYGFIATFYKRNNIYLTPNVIKRINNISKRALKTNIYYEITKK